MARAPHLTLSDQLHNSRLVTFSVLLQTKRLLTPTDGQIYWWRIVCPTREMENGRFSEPIAASLPPSLRLERDPRRGISFKFTPRSCLDRKGFRLLAVPFLATNGRPSQPTTRGMSWFRRKFQTFSLRQRCFAYPLSSLLSFSANPQQRQGRSACPGRQ